MVLQLAACGFALRGAYTFPESMDTLYVSADDRFSGFYRALVAELERAGVSVVDAPSEDAATLTILADSTGQRVLSVSARNVPTEYEVFYTVEVSLADGEESLLLPQVLTLTRDYTYDANFVLGKAAEEQQLRDAIVDDLVRLVLRQIDSL